MYMYIYIIYIYCVCVPATSAVGYINMHICIYVFDPSQRRGGGGGGGRMWLRTCDTRGGLYICI